MADTEIAAPSVPVEPSDEAPVKTIDAKVLAALGQNLWKTFDQYKSDRRIVELKWMRNLRQYLGIYDPDVEQQLPANRSRAYPRITRVKCVSVLSRLINLMFPGNERNWDLKASPAPDMSPQDVMQAIQTMQQKDQEQGAQIPLTDARIAVAVQRLANERAEELKTLIDDQLQEIGGDQTVDYIGLNRKVVASGIMYGIGCLRGPFVRTAKATKWTMVQDPTTGQAMPQPQEVEAYKPMFEFLPVWDFYPDLSAKTLGTMDGYFTRLVMSRAQVRKLAKRPGFFADVIRDYLSNNMNGNYVAQPFEQDLRTMGIKANVDDKKTEVGKYEVIIWHGPVSGGTLAQAGAEVKPENFADDIEAEVWMIDGKVIKADVNTWRKINADVKTIHIFNFDEDDTSPIGNGLPNVMRDSQMSVAASARMLLDNASVVCGPQLELNTDLLRPDQDITSVHAFKMWYRDGMGADASQPAIRNVQIDGHLDELMKTIDLFMRFADLETFVGPATGGDMQKGPSEPFRTAAGASMLRGDAALPFKDIVRNFDSFTQSVIYALVQFNRVFNPDRAKAGDYDVIARGATSLIAKEIRGVQIDTIATTLTPAEQLHVDERKLVEARFAVRDLNDILLPMDEVERKQAAQAQAQQAQMEQQQKLTEATIRKTLSDAFKNIAQGQKNSAAADATKVQAALNVLEAGMEDDIQSEG